LLDRRDNSSHGEQRCRRNSYCEPNRARSGDLSPFNPQTLDVVYLNAKSGVTHPGFNDVLIDRASGRIKFDFLAGLGRDSDQMFPLGLGNLADVAPVDLGHMATAAEQDETNRHENGCPLSTFWGD
jgi:hypothetical protein